MGRPKATKKKVKEVEIEVEVLPNVPTEPTPLIVDQPSVPNIPVHAILMSKDMRKRTRNFSEEPKADKNGRKWRSLIPKK